MSGINKTKKEFDSLTESIKKFENVFKAVADGVNNAVNKIVGVIRTGVKVTSGIVGGVVKGIRGIGSGASKIISLFGSFGNRVRGGLSETSTGFKGLAGSATELYSKIRLLQMGFNAIFNNRLTESASKLYSAVYSLKSTVGTELAQGTVDWAYSLENAFGIDAKGLISDLAQINNIVRNLGMSAEDANTAAKNLTLMSRHLAYMGHYGGNIAGVQEAILSGMKGETQAIDNLGLSVRASQMDSYLASLKAQGGEFAGISSKLEGLNEQQRVYVRYAALMEQYMSKNNMEDFIRSMDTVTGRVSALKEATKSLGTTIGQVFIKLFSSIAPYLTVMVKFIQGQVIALANFLSRVFKIDLNVDVFAGMNGGVDAVNNSLNDTKSKLDEVDKKAKKAKGTLMGWDRIDSINTDSGSDKDGIGGGDDFDYSKLMTSALGAMDKLAADATETYMDRLNDKFKAKLDDMQESLKQFAKDVTGRADFDIGFDAAKAKESLKAIINNLKGIIKNSGMLVISIGLKVADDVNIGLIVNKVLELASAISNLLNVLTGKLNPVLNEIYDRYIAKYVVAIGEWLVNAIDKAITGINNLADKINGLSIDEFIEGITNLDKLRETHPIIADILEIVMSLTGIVKTLAFDIILPLLKSLASFGKNEFLPWLNENLKQLGSWVSDNKDKIVDLIEKVGNIAFDSFKIFVGLVGKLIDFVVQHPDSVILFFSGLLALKVGSWLAGTVVGLGKFVESVTLLKTALAGGEILSGLSGLGSGLMGIATGPIGLVIAGIGILVLIIADLWNTSEDFHNKFTSLGENISGALGRLKDTLFGSDDSLGGSIGRLWESLKQFGSTLYELYENTLKPVLEFVITVAGEGLAFVLVRLIDIITLLAGVISGALAGALDVLTGFMDIIIGFITFDFERMGQGLIGIFKGIGEMIIGGLGEGVNAAWQSFMSSVNEKWVSFVESVKSFFGIHSPSTLFADIGNNLIQGLLSGIEAVWGGVTSNIIGKFSGLASGIKGTFSDIGSWFSGIFSSIGSTFDKMFTSLGSKFDKLKEKTAKAAKDIASGDSAESST